MIEPIHFHVYFQTITLSYKVFSAFLAFQNFGYVLSLDIIITSGYIISKIIKIIHPSKL